MAGIEGLRKVQMGRETTAGTPVAATSIWRGRGLPTAGMKLVLPKEDTGILGDLDRSYIPFIDAGFKFDSTPATYEQLPHILDAGIAVATPTRDGTGSGYVYSYTLAESALPTIKTYTLQGGDDQQEETLEYAFVDEFNLQGASKEAVMVDARWVGRQLTTSTFTTSLTQAAVSEVLFGQGKLYIDAITGTAGTTQKTAVWIGFKLNVKTGLKPVFTADGNLYFTTHYIAEPAATCELTFLHNSIGRAQVDAMLAQTPQLFRLKFEGPALTTSSTYTKKTLIIDFAGKYEQKPELTAKDGNDTVTLKVLIKRNTGSTNFANKRLEIKVVNELATLP